MHKPGCRNHQKESQQSPAVNNYIRTEHSSPSEPHLGKKTPESDRSGLSRLGDSSDLFDEHEETHFTFDSPPTFSLVKKASSKTQSRNRTSGSKSLESGVATHHTPCPPGGLAYKMVNEREPPATPGGVAGKPTLTNANALPSSNPQNDIPRIQQAPIRSQPDLQPVPKPLYELANSTPEFGKTSPLRNPLARTNNNIFNIPRPGQSRPEHHRPKPAAGPQFKVPSSLAQSHSAGNQPPLQARPLYPAPAASAAPSAPLYPILPGTQRPPVPSGRPTYPDVVEIPRPTNLPTFTTQPAPRPMFSSWATVNAPMAGKPIIDLTRTEDEDAINPDDAFKYDGFGAPDPYQYVDTTKANENIKELLEGAFEDDEEEKPKLRRLRRKVKSVEQKVTASLASRLEALEVGKGPKAEATEEENEEEDDEVDDGTVDGMKVKLLPHQVDGVAWMTDKEIGKKKTKGVFPKGGILADDMGLGKTIQSVALILTNSRPDPSEQPKTMKNRIPDTVSKCTLVVAPLALIKQWEAEIKDKVEKTHTLRVLIHHGPNRKLRGQDLEKYDVVITTYQILASEHAGNPNSQMGCFGVHWYRVILDEAHTIKNRNAKSTQACYALRSHFRWCLTGTPMQNNLDELQSLIRFLRIKPYCDLAPWKAQITEPMKKGRGGLAMRRLQYVLKAFMKRRTKDILKKEGALNPGGKPKEGETRFRIVERKVEILTVEFDHAERQFYQRLHDRAEKRLNEIMRGEKADYMGALTLLLRLRQACNHPTLVGGVSTKDSDALTAGATGASGVPSGAQTPSKSKTTEKEIDDIADLLGGLSVAQKKCDVCQKILHKGDAAEGSVRCNECEADLNFQKGKKGKSSKHSSKRDEHRKSKAAPELSPSAKPKARQRPVVVDSDDEDQGGEWVVPESERNVKDMGKAGGTDDENAEGGGEWLNSDDSVTDNESPEKLEHPKDKVISLATSEEDVTASSVAEDSDDSSSSEASCNNSPLSDESDSEEEQALWPSTKIRHLVQILRRESAKHKFIVFSQFTSMLDIVEPFLKKEGFVFTRYDGSMRNDQREMSLNKLRNDPRCRILLCSLKCGSLGLNLTAASRVVILEPFWNPFVEEQAIDRVHRLNQTVDVHIYRLTIVDSVEERILALQEAKRNLATAAIEGGAKALNKLSMQDILMLFRHDAHDDAAHGKAEQMGAFLGKTRVLEAPGSSRSQWMQVGESSDRNQSSKPSQRPPRVEHSVYGRR